MVGTKQYAWNQATHTAGRGTFAVGKEALLSLGTNKRMLYAAPIAGKRKINPASTLAVAHKLRSRGTAKRLSRRQQLNRLYEVGLPHRIASDENRDVGVELDIKLLEATVIAHRKRACKHIH